jgi:hypothetical protein
VLCLLARCRERASLRHLRKPLLLLSITPAPPPPPPPLAPCLCIAVCVVDALQAVNVSFLNAHMVQHCKFIQCVQCMYMYVRRV